MEPYTSPLEMDGMPIQPDRPPSVPELLTKENSALFREIFSLSTDGISILDRDGYYYEQNEAHRALLGYTDADLAHRTPAIHLGERQFAEIAAELKDKGFYRGEIQSRAKSGQTFDIELSAFSIRNEAGEPVAFVGIKRNISERKRHEAELHRRYQQLQVVYQLTKNLSSYVPLEEIYQEALAAIQGALGVDKASILLFDQDGIMRFRAWSGLSDEYRARVEGHSPWSPEEKNPQAIVIADVEQEPNLDSLRSIILSEGIRALGFIPLLFQGRLLGKFMIYFGERHAFLEEELQQAQHIADCIAIAIERRRAEEEIQKLNRALLQKVQDYENLVKDLQKSRAELQGKVQELERFEDAVVGRELKMISMEKELERLKSHQ